MTLKKKTWLCVILLMILSTTGLTGQSRVIRGKVIASEGGSFKSNPDKEFGIIPAPHITYNESISYKAKTIEGVFEIKIPEGVTEIKIGWIGMAWETIPITPNCDYLEVILIPDSNGSNRQRKKQRKIIPELYKIAFKHGLIQNSVPCR